jgi:hypothetical protein
MQKTVDVPDALYRKLNAKAAKERQLILRAIEGALRRRVSLPLIRSKHPGTLDIDNAEIYELISFP